MCLESRFSCESWEYTTKGHNNSWPLTNDSAAWKNIIKNNPNVQVIILKIVTPSLQNILILRCCVKTVFIDRKNFKNSDFCSFFQKISKYWLYYLRGTAPPRRGPPPASPRRAAGLFCLFKLLWFGEVRFRILGLRTLGLRTLGFLILGLIWFSSSFDSERQWISRLLLPRR